PRKVRPANARWRFQNWLRRDRDAVAGAWTHCCQNLDGQSVLGLLRYLYKIELAGKPKPNYENVMENFTGWPAAGRTARGGRSGRVVPGFSHRTGGGKCPQTLRGAGHR